jgi:hypothetical protein
MEGVDGVTLRNLSDELLARFGLGPTSSPSSPETPAPGDVVVGDGIATFSRGGKTYTVSIADVTMRFTVGSLLLVQAFDPQLNPQIELYGLPENIQQWILHIAAQQMRPGRYQYFVNVSSDVSTLTDYIADSNAPMALPGWPNPPGLAGNSNKTFSSKPIPATAYANVTFHADNETNQSATLTVYGSYTPNPGTPPTGWMAVATGLSIAAGTNGALGVDLTKTIYPFLIAVVVYATAPTSGFLRIVPVAKRAQ